MLGWREDRINVPPALLPVILASHILVKSHSSFLEELEQVCAFLLLHSFNQSFRLHVDVHPAPRPVKPISYPFPTFHTFPMHPWNYTKHNQQTPHHFLSVHPEDRDHPTDHFSSPEDAGGTGHFFCTTAIPEHLLSPKKTLKL